MSATPSFAHLETALRLFHGNDALNSLPTEMMRSQCSRAVIVCGRSVAVHGLQRVREALGDGYVGVFDGVRAHSPVTTVDAAAAALRALDADCVVAVGGGSAIVTARACAIVLAEKKPAHQLCTRRQASGVFTSPRLLAPKLPQFVVPTTPTTATVKAGAAVFDEAVSERLALFDPKTRAQAVFIDPGLVGATPVDLFVSASLNTLAMAVEGLESAHSDPLSDAMLLHALRLLYRALPDLRAKPKDATLRIDLMMAAVLCGRGTDFAGGGLASVLGHAVGMRGNVSNGLANAMVLPHTMRFNAGVTSQRTAPIAQALGGSEGADPMDQVCLLLDKLGIPFRLRDAGFTHASLDDVATHAMDDWFLTRNPRPVQDVAQLKQLLLAAW